MSFLTIRRRAAAKIISAGNRHLKRRKNISTHAHLSTERAGVGRGIRLWCAQHFQALINSLGQYAYAPTGQFLTTVVTGIALSLPVAFFLLLENAQQLTARWERVAQFSAFLDEAADVRVAEKLRADLQADPEITEVVLIDKAQSLLEYRQWSNVVGLIDSFDENPLPHVLTFQALQDGKAAAEHLMQRVAAMPNIDLVQYDGQWMVRLLAIIDILERVAVLLSCILAVAVLVIVSNTIRLSVYNRKAEIEIIKLFGATDAFIQRPFLYSGFWYGFFGTLLAWALVTVSLLAVELPLRELVRTYNSTFSFITLGPRHLICLFVAAVGLGLLGSWLAVRRYIKAVEPA